VREQRSAQGAADKINVCETSRLDHPLTQAVLTCAGHDSHEITPKRTVLPPCVHIAPFRVVVLSYDKEVSSMEELIKQVSEKAGITEEQARTAVQTVADYLKERVPAPYSSYIDRFMSGGGRGGGFMGGLGGMFGNK